MKKKIKLVSGLRNKQWRKKCEKLFNAGYEITHLKSNEHGFAGIFQLKEQSKQGNTTEITDLKRQIETNRQIFNREISELRKQIEDLDEYLITRLKEII